jgi:hypothetical protein
LGSGRPSEGSLATSVLHLLGTPLTTIGVALIAIAVVGLIIGFVRTAAFPPHPPQRPRERPLDRAAGGPPVDIDATVHTTLYDVHGPRHLPEHQPHAAEE